MFTSKVFSFFFVCLLAVCGDSKAQLENVPQTPQTDKIELSLTMKRTACLGHCPVYELNIKPDGKVIFEGIQDTKVKGKTESNLSKEKTNQLISEIENAGFFLLKDFYDKGSGNCPTIATDNPTVTLSIKFNEKGKVITHYLGCIEEPLKMEIFPQKLYNLENKIDQIVETKRWIREGK